MDQNRKHHKIAKATRTRPLPLLASGIPVSADQLDLFDKPENHIPRTRFGTAPKRKNRQYVRTGITRNDARHREYARNHPQYHFNFSRFSGPTDRLGSSRDSLYRLALRDSRHADTGTGNSKVCKKAECRIDFYKFATATDLGESSSRSRNFSAPPARSQHNELRALSYHEKIGKKDPETPTWRKLPGRFQTLTGKRGQVVFEILAGLVFGCLILGFLMKNFERKSALWAREVRKPWFISK